MKRSFIYGWRRLKTKQFAPKTVIFTLHANIKGFTHTLSFHQTIISISSIVSIPQNYVCAIRNCRCRDMLCGVHDAGISHVQRFPLPHTQHLDYTQAI